MAQSDGRSQMDLKLMDTHLLVALGLESDYFELLLVSNGTKRMTKL